MHTAPGVRCVFLWVLSVDDMLVGYKHDAEGGQSYQRYDSVHRSHVRRRGNVGLLVYVGLVIMRLWVQLLVGLLLSYLLLEWVTCKISRYIISTKNTQVFDPSVWGGLIEYWCCWLGLCCWVVGM